MTRPVRHRCQPDPHHHRAQRRYRSRRRRNRRRAHLQQRSRRQAPRPSRRHPARRSATGAIVGTVTIGDTDYFGDALLTEDGAIRLYVGGPGTSSGAIQGRTLGGTAQFVGNVELFGGASCPGPGS